MSDDRTIPNRLVDFDASRPDLNLYSTDGTLTADFQQKIQNCILTLTEQIDSALRHKNAEGTSAADDSSVYTGICGIAILFEKLSRVQHDNEHLQKSLHLIEKCLAHLRGRKFTFMCGDSGPLAVAAVVYKQSGKQDKSHECVERLRSNHTNVALNVPQMPDEILYGRAGYLYACLYVNKHVDGNAIPKQIVLQVANDMLASGQAYAKQCPQLQTPLMYEWHDSLYLGAAHGLAGILFLLMEIPEIMSDKHKSSLVRGCLDFCLSLQYPSGNYPSSIGSRSDRLIHWCHGAPGWVHTMIVAHKMYHDQKYLDSAIRCGDVIWQRGLLRKGYGLCHGTAGNAYAFVALWQHTRDLKWLHRACKFAEFLFDYGKHGCRVADRPYSLMEGMAGTVYFLVDMLQPNAAAFPAFYV